MVAVAAVEYLQTCQNTIIIVLLLLFLGATVFCVFLQLPAITSMSFRHLMSCNRLKQITNIKMALESGNNYGSVFNKRKSLFGSNNIVKDMHQSFERGLTG